MSIDQAISASLAFEVPILPYPLGDTTGAAHIGHLQTKEGRGERQRLSRDFWEESWAGGENGLFGAKPGTR